MAFRQHVPLGEEGGGHFQLIFIEALGRSPSTVPFPALIDTQPREESLCTRPVDMVLNVSVDPALCLQAVLPYTWTVM